MNKKLLKMTLVALGMVAGSVNSWADETKVFTQDFTPVTIDGEISTNPTDYGFTESTITGSASAIVSDGMLTSTVGGEKGNGQNGNTVSYTDFSAVGSGKILNVNFYWETGNATGKSKSSCSQIYLSDNEGKKVLELTFYGQDKRLYVNGKDVCAMNRNSKVDVSAIIDVSSMNIETLKVGSVYSGENIAFKETANEISRFGFFHTTGTKLTWKNSSSIDNINITYEESTVETAAYTIQYIDKENNSLKKIERVGNVGEKVVLTDNDKEAFFNTDNTKKYIYESDNASAIEIKSDGSSVVYVVCREAATYNYTVNAVDENNTVLKAIATGTAFEGDNVKIAYPYYYNNKGQLLRTEKVGKGECNYTFTANEDNIVKSIVYKPTSIKNVVYYSEAEDIEGLTIVNDGNSAIRSSNSASAYAKDGDVVFTTLPAGSYRLSTVICDFKGTTPTATFNFKAGENTIFTFPAKNINWSEGTSDVFTLTENTDIALAQGGNSKQAVDFIYIQQIPTTVKVSSAKYATFVTTEKMVAPKEVAVKTVTVEDNKVVLHDVAADAVIPAGTAILVNAEAGNYDFTVSTAEATTIENNALVAATSDVTATGKEYALTQQNGVVGFARVQEGVVIPAGKAYLVVEQTAEESAAKFLAITVGGETTGINGVNATAADSDAYYTLQGQKTLKPAKGLYIHNGKKVIIK